ncbi:hypothetical protein JCM10207_004637 [Rhodosporidiobolus poonsookiae]
MMSSYSSYSHSPKPTPKPSTSHQVTLPLLPLLSTSTTPQSHNTPHVHVGEPYDDQPTQRFVIGKIDAGIAVLISDSVHLIEFPSLLLPPGVGPGSIVNIACSRNVSAEKAHARDFWDLQRDIFDEFGANEPSAPQLSVRNTTQTSVTLEWDKLDLASASLISLLLYRNGQRLTTIPNPLTNTSTKLSGLQLDTDYSFHLVLKTSAGTFSSPIVKTRTHTIDNTTGVRVCFGLVEPEELFDEARKAVEAMGAQAEDKIQIDTTHYIGTSSASRGNPRGGPGVEYQKAVQLSIPVVSPEWLLACHRASKLVPISAYYLGQTNHAASLSSAQLVSSPPARAAELASPTVAQGQPQGRKAPTPPVVLEEPEAVPTPPPVTLEEDVEGPPRDDVVDDEEVVLSAPAPAPATEPEPAPAPAPAPALEQKEDAPAPETAETDASIKGVKSEPEEEEPAGESEQDAPDAPEPAKEEEASGDMPAELEAKPDAPGEELEAEKGEEVAAEAEPKPAVAEEVKEDKVDEAPTKEDGERAPVDAPGEDLLVEEQAKEGAADEEKKEDEKEKKDDKDGDETAGETSLVDITF